MRLIALLVSLLAAGGASAQGSWDAHYPEGPVWLDGTLYWAEMRADRVMAWDGGSPREAFRRPGCGPTAIARYRDADILVLCHLEGALAHLDRESKLLGMFRTSVEGHRLRDPNDASADGEGGVWFTDPGRFSIAAPAEGAIYHLAPDGRLTRHVTGLAYGNGVHVDRSGARLLVSEHLARRVLAYPLTADGLGPPKVLFNLDDFALPRGSFAETGPDGLEFDADGTLWVAEYGAGRLLGWRPGRGLVAALTVGARFVTNIAFGPDGLAAVTAARSLGSGSPPGTVWVLEAGELTAVVQQ